MKNRKLIHLTWLIPLALAGLFLHQLSVFYGMDKTVNEGQRLNAAITDFRIKQIAAQTNGYIDLSFMDVDGNQVSHRLSLHVQHAAQLMESNQVTIRYRPGARYHTVIESTYRYQRRTVKINLAVIGVSFLVMASVSVFASRYAINASGKARNDNLELEIIK